MRLLIVEDNALLADGLQRGLQLQGITCDVASTAAAANAYLASSTYDCCVLDVGLPDGSGLALLQRWRAQGLCLPVLVLTARDTLDDKLNGFDSGADDYLTKPFDLQELAARLHALHRRSAGRASDWLHWSGGALRLNLAHCQAWYHDQPVELARREWALLAALVQANGRVLSTEQLHDQLYGFAQEVGSNTVNVHIHHLRKKLGADLIETVRGLGFRLGASYCRGAQP